MATTTLTDGQFGAYARTLAAGVVDTVVFPREVNVEVWTDGSAAVYFVVDGSTPTIAGASTFEVPPGAPAFRNVSGVLPGSAAGTVVRLISAATPKYSVRGS